MKLAYLLEDTALSGSARMLLAQADGLVARGHRVRIITKGAEVTWRSSRAEWIYVDDFREYAAGEDEIVVAPGAVKEHLVDEEVFRDAPRRESEPLRVLLCGEWQNEQHGMQEGYGAVLHARWFHQTLELVRVSKWAPSREEPLEAVQEFHVGLTTAEMTRLMHSCDVLVAPTHRKKPFALTTAEGLASGLACVLTMIPAYLTIDSRHDFALFAPEDNAVELGERLMEVLEDRQLRDRLRQRACAVAEQWRPANVLDRIEAALLTRRPA